MSRRSYGVTTAFGGVVNEAPASAQGKPTLVKPNDKANVEGRIHEINQRTDELVANLSAPSIDHAPIARKRKKA